MALYGDPTYLAQFWIVILHIILVVASMWGAAARRLDRAAGFVVLGFLGYLLFAAAELLRMALLLFAVNASWRAGYAVTNEPILQERFLTHLQGWSGIAEALFFLLIMGFMLGNLFLGSVLVRGRGLERLVGAALLVWSLLGVWTHLLEHVRLPTVPQQPEWLAYTFQPAVRILIAIWLWRAASESATDVADS
ncbi:MAG: hypothetical protein MJE77_02635 [Proteobacteria bacterium]|nr:hypothetical protein [Pseudomonadota bacterium]